MHNVLCKGEVSARIFIIEGLILPIRHFIVRKACTVFLNIWKQGYTVLSQTVNVLRYFYVALRYWTLFSK